MITEELLIQTPQVFMRTIKEYCRFNQSLIIYNHTTSHVNTTNWSIITHRCHSIAHSTVPLYSIILFTDFERLVHHTNTR